MVRLRKHSHRSPSHISSTNSTNWSHVVCVTGISYLTIKDFCSSFKCWITGLSSFFDLPTSETGWWIFIEKKYSKTNVIGSNSWKDKLQLFWLHNDALLKWLTEPKKTEKIIHEILPRRKSLATSLALTWGVRVLFILLRVFAASVLRAWLGICVFSTPFIADNSTTCYRWLRFSSSAVCWTIPGARSFQHNWTPVAGVFVFLQKKRKTTSGRPA